MNAAGPVAGAPRVTFVCDSDAWGGAEVYLTHLLRRATVLGWSASLVCAEPVAGRFLPVVGADALTVVPLHRHSADAPSIRSALLRRRPDVAAVNLVDPGSHAAAVTAALAVAPTVGILHLDGDIGRGGERADLAALFAGLAAVLTPSSRVRRQLTGGLGVPPARVHLVPNGVDVPQHPAGPAGRPVPRVGALGRLTAQKGFDVLVDAVRLLASRGRSLEAVVGGAGRDGEALRAASAGLPVTFCGFVEDARGFLAGLDVFCLSSRREALPLVLLEAMAEGLPCVATDVGDVRRAAGKSVVVVPPENASALADALGGLLTDAGLRRDLGQGARRLAVRSHDADLMAWRTFGLLDRARWEPAAPWVSPRAVPAGASP